MTEAEWLASEDPKPMIEFLGDKTSARKLLLFVVNCCYLVYGQSKVIPAFEAVEKFVDDQATLDEVRRYWLSSTSEITWPERPFEWAMTYVNRCPISGREVKADGGCYPTATQVLPIIRDVFGNPFREVTLDSAYLTWNSATIPMLAQAVYNNRAFDRLPLLADALEVIGCTNGDVLSHLRGPGPHVKACWALDLLCCGRSDTP